MKIMDVMNRIIAAQRTSNTNLPLDNREFAKMLDVAEKEMAIDGHVADIKAYCKAVREAGGTCRGCKFHNIESLYDMLGCKIGTPYSWEE